MAARSSRSYAGIVRANVFTVFNLILAVAGVMTLAFGEWQDALFLGVLVANATIGTVQEVRAKRALDRLTALVVPHARMIEGDRERTVAVEDLTTGMLLRVEPGDQIVADGVLERVVALRVDESILTGESEPGERTAGEVVRSGAFVVEGSATFAVTAVGVESVGVSFVPTRFAV